jgi:glycosyltransferase involved in cell wall biosynthesis
VRVVRVPPSGPARTGKYLMLPGVLAALRRERGRFDVMVVRGSRVLGLPGLIWARACGAAVVLQPEVNGELSGEVYTWGTPLDRPPLRGLVRAVTAQRNRLLKDADAFVAMSQLIRQELLEAGVPPQKVALIPHGVDLDVFRPADPDERRALRQRLGLPVEVPIAAFTGRLLRGKGLEILIDAFARLASEAVPAHLLIVGSGAGQALSVEDRIKAQVSERGLDDRVTLTGRVDNVDDYLRACDVFAFPSVFEALGLSLIEAAACGLACVASRTGGIVDVVDDGVSGLLFEPENTIQLADCLRIVLADDPRRRAMGERGRDLARRRFDALESLERYRAQFRELSPRSRSGGQVSE